MSWTQSVQGENPELQKSMAAPIGAMSPLWWAFAGAASAGVAYWWMTRWAKPINIEAVSELPPGLAGLEAMEEAAATYEMSPEAIEDVVDTPALDVELEAPLAIAAATAMSESMPDDLTQLIGVGPKLALALAERGVTQFAQIAAWSADDLTYFDRELKLLGRAVRDGWVEQARTFLPEPASVD